MKYKTLVLAALVLPASLQAALVKGYEFNGATTEDFVVGSSTGVTVAGGLLTATASNSDPTLIANSASVLFSKAASQTWTDVIFKVRETDELGVFVQPYSPAGIVLQIGPNQNFVAPNNLTLTITGNFTSVETADGFSTVTFDISGYTANDVRYFRLDPIGGTDAAGNTYEVDFIRFNAVPEPSAALLGALGALALLRRRR